MAEAATVGQHRDPEVRRDGGTLEALDKLVTKLGKQKWSCASFTKPVPAATPAAKNGVRAGSPYAGTAPAAASSAKPRGNTAVQTNQQPLANRHQNQSKEIRAISWKAQQRLHHRYKALSAARKKSVVVVTAIARELAGFNLGYRIACHVKAPEKLKPSSMVPKPTVVRTYTLDATRNIRKKASGV